MNLRAESLEAHLAKAKLAPVYAVHGDEPLLALEAADALRAAARRRGLAERTVLYAERGFDWSEFLHALAARSLFGGGRIVELRIASGKPGAQGAAALERYCADSNPEALLLVTLPRLERAAQASSWFVALGAAGVVIDVFPVERARLPAWIGERLARQGQRASREVLEFLAERVEGNLLAAHQEVQKLALLAPAGELDPEAVRAAVANVARYDTYAAAQALLAGDRARYVRVIEGLRGEGEAPSYVLWAISEELRAAVRVQAGLAAGRTLEELLREHRVWGPRQSALKAALKRYSRGALERALLECARIDRAIKGVACGEPWQALVVLGLELACGSEA